MAIYQDISMHLFDAKLEIKQMWWFCFKEG